MFEKQDSYTPTEAKRASEELDRLVARKKLTSRQAGAHRRHIASRIQLSLKPAYSTQAAKRAKTEIIKLTEAGTITSKSAAAYRAHITKRTVEA
jgi:hypothetical protein